MSKWFLTSMAGAASLLVAALAVVHWATSDAEQVVVASSPSAVQAAPSPAAEARPPAGPRSDAPAVPATPQPAATSSSAGVHRAPAPPSRSAGGSLESDFVRVRRNFRDELEHGLSVLQQSVAECSAASASFKLDLESIPGGIRIKDAQVEDKGDVSDRAIACAQSKLREHVIDAPSVEPGRKWQISLAIRAP